MEIHPGDLLEMKKEHPCGGKIFLVLRSGMDFRLRCTNCGREIMIPRRKAEKNIKRKMEPSEEEGNGGCLKI